MAEEFIKFVNASRSPFHAVKTCKDSLKASGFNELSEQTSFSLKPGGKYFYSRNQSTLVAFAIGNKFKPGNGFNVIGAHTDSPIIKLKPVSNYKGSGGWLNVGCSLYGGGLWHTWFDRDLALAGRVIVKTNEGFESRLVDIRKPLMRIPSLAIHLDRTANDNFKCNYENNFRPILETAIKTKFETKDTDLHNNSLMELISKTLGVNKSDIQSFEMCVADNQDSVIGGINDEFIFSARLDNLMSSFCGLKALCETSTDESLSNEENVRMLLLFDNEEIGSRSAYGAMSPMLSDAFERLCGAVSHGEPLSDLVHVTKRRSFLISADMAHALHPNYPEYHESKHQPALHKGPVIKYNVEQRYATTSETSFVIEHLAQKHNIPVQKFCVKNDTPCGSTIGPILAAETGVRTVDIGNPQLSMHSIREMCGVDDVKHCIDLMKVFYTDFAALDKTLKMEI